jgi:hypothetical protein
VHPLRAAALVCAALLAIPPVVSADITTPAAHFGFRMGDDGQLAGADAIEHYFERVASESDRVKIVDLGPTTEGHRTIAAIITAPENLRRLEEIRRTNERLADPRTLAPDEARRLAAAQPAVVVIGGSIHASEIGATQAANELLYSLTSSNDSATQTVLRNVVVIVIPSLNPDGHRLVVDWYQRTKGTSFEGGPMPWLYHKYAGHDINRDAFMMNLVENRNLARFFYSVWHPQVFLTMHQMEMNGPRFFVPPNTDPIDPNYDPLIWRTAALLGDAMALELQRDRHLGVVSNAKYDYYWPGFEDSAPIGHNTVCLLTEVASVNIASPVSINPAELRAGFKGLPDYRAQINFPEPWPGGRWTLRDIVEYDLSAVRGLLFASAVYRDQLVLNFYDMGRRAVEDGRRGGPFAFVIPPGQHDPHAVARLEQLLIDGGVEIHRAREPFRADGTEFPAGSDVILLAQPYRAYVKTLFERQSYPIRRSSPNGAPERPYDVAGWTLPVQMGVAARTIERSFDVPPMSKVTKATAPTATVGGETRPTFWVVDARGAAGATAVNRLIAGGAAASWTTEPADLGGIRWTAGSLVIPYSKPAELIVASIATDLGLRVEGVKSNLPPGRRPIGRVRTALYQPWLENIDEGWTRWVLEQYEFPFVSIKDAEIRAGNLRARYDVIILPSAPADRLISGHPAGTVPTEYTGGLGSIGVDALKTFVQAGGTLICLAQASSLAIGAFQLPIRDVAREREDRFFCPGSILSLDLDPSQPLAYGMERHTAAFFTYSSAFEPVAPRGAPVGHSGDPPPARSVDMIARYAKKDVLISGWLEGEEIIAGRGAVAQARIGGGQVILLGFPVQHRGQSYATFRLLFNAVFAGAR